MRCWRFWELTLSARSVSFAITCQTPCQTLSLFVWESSLSANSYVNLKGNLAEKYCEISKAISLTESENSSKTNSKCQWFDNERLEIWVRKFFILLVWGNVLRQKLSASSDFSCLLLFPIWFAVIIHFDCVFLVGFDNQLHKFMTHHIFFAEMNKLDAFDVFQNFLCFL